MTKQPHYCWALLRTLILLALFCLHPRREGERGLVIASGGGQQFPTRPSLTTPWQGVGVSVSAWQGCSLGSPFGLYWLEGRGRTGLQAFPWHLIGIEQLLPERFVLLACPFPWFLGWRVGFVVALVCCFLLFSILGVSWLPASLVLSGTDEAKRKPEDHTTMEFLESLGP